MRRGSRLAASGLALGVLLVSATASGYCRTTTCDPRRQACPRDAQGCMTGGIPLAWPEACVGFSVQRDGSVKLGIDAGTLRGIVTDAFATWQAAACAPTIAWSPLEDASCAEVQYNSQAPNANLWLFRDEVWPYDGGHLRCRRRAQRGAEPARRPRSTRPSRGGLALDRHARSGACPRARPQR